jgi:hypothetical protein
MENLTTPSFFTSTFKQQLQICVSAEIEYYGKNTIAHKNALRIQHSLKSEKYNKIVLQKIHDLVSDYSNEFSNSTFFISHLLKY